VQDAVRSDADQNIERLKEELKKGNLNYEGIDRNDPQNVD
jgi:hypothetical protein